MAFLTRRVSLSVVDAANKSYSNVHRNRRHSFAGVEGEFGTDNKNETTSTNPTSGNAALPTRILCSNPSSWQNASRTRKTINGSSTSSVKTVRFDDTLTIHDAITVPSPDRRILWSNKPKAVRNELHPNQLLPKKSKWLNVKGFFHCDDIKIKTENVYSIGVCTNTKTFHKAFTNCQDNSIEQESKLISLSSEDPIQRKHPPGALLKDRPEIYYLRRSHQQALEEYFTTHHEQLKYLRKNMWSEEIKTKRVDLSIKFIECQNRKMKSSLEKCQPDSSTNAKTPVTGKEVTAKININALLRNQTVNITYRRENKSLERQTKLVRWAHEVEVVSYKPDLPMGDTFPFKNIKKCRYNASYSTLISSTRALDFILETSSPVRNLWSGIDGGSGEIRREKANKKSVSFEAWVQVIIGVEVDENSRIEVKKAERRPYNTSFDAVKEISQGNKITLEEINATANAIRRNIERMTVFFRGRGTDESERSQKVIATEMEKLKTLENTAKNMARKKKYVRFANVLQIIPVENLPHTDGITTDNQTDGNVSSRSRIRMQSMEIIAVPL